MKPTAEQVLRAVRADKDCANLFSVYAGSGEMYLPFIEGIVVVLHDLLETIVTPESVVEAKVRYLCYCIDYGLATVIADAAGKDKEVRTMAAATIDQMFKKAIKNMDARAVGQDIARRMTPDNRESFFRGKLTIGELLLTQPSVLL